MDALDRRILNALQRDASQSMAVLAEEVSSTPATCHRRYQKLRKSGAIRKIIAVIDPGIAPEMVTVLIGLTMGGQNPQAQRKLRRFLKTEDDIKQVWMTTGSFDYLAMGSFPKVEIYMEFLERLGAQSDLESYRTFVSIEETKFEIARTLPAD